MVSVIIPNYNHEGFLKQRIDSVLNQSYEDFEVIILDDHSTDQSRTIIREFHDHPKVSRVVLNKANSGSPFAQWNKGIEHAKGDLIWIAESDDLADKEFIQTLVPFFDQDPELGLVYCQSNSLTENDEITGNWKSWTDDLDKDLFENDFILSGTEYINRFLIVRNTIPNASAVIFKKEKYVEAGKANEKINYCSDWLTWLKLLTMSNVAFNPTLLNSFRKHDQSVISLAPWESSTIYIHSFEKKMREEFNNFLKSYNRADLTSIKRKNGVLINNLYREEGLFHIRQKNWTKGWLFIFIASKKKLSLYIIFKAGLLSIKSAFTCPNFRERL